jgi:hypothetical protein
MGNKHSEIKKSDYEIEEEEQQKLHDEKMKQWAIEDEQLQKVHDEKMKQQQEVHDEKMKQFDIETEQRRLEDERQSAIFDQHLADISSGKIEKNKYISYLEQIRESHEFKQSIIEEDAGTKPLKFIINAHGYSPIYKHRQEYNTTFILPENAYLITSSANGDILSMIESQRQIIENEFIINPFFENENTTNNPTPFLLDLENKISDETNYNFTNHFPTHPVNNIMLSGEKVDLQFHYVGWWKVGYNNEMNSCLGRNFGNVDDTRNIINNTTTSTNLEEVINEILECYPGKTCIILVLACRGGDRDNWILDNVALDIIYNIVIDTLDIDTVDTIYSSLPKTFEPNIAYSIARSIELLKEIGLPITHMNIIYALSILPTDRSDNHLSQTPRVTKAVSSPRSRKFGNNIDKDWIFRTLRNKFFTNYTFDKINSYSEYMLIYELFIVQLALPISTQLVPIIMECLKITTNIDDLRECTLSKITPEVLRIMNLNSGNLSGGSKKSRRSKRSRRSKKNR